MALMYVIEYYLQVLDWLLENGAKLMVDNLGGSPLHDAAEHGRLHVRTPFSGLLLLPGLKFVTWKCLSVQDF